MSAEFPKYSMKINGQKRFMSFNEAAWAFSSNNQVELLREVLEVDFSVRQMTNPEVRLISDASDRIAASV